MIDKKNGHRNQLISAVKGLLILLVGGDILSIVFRQIEDIRMPLC